MTGFTSVLCSHLCSRSWSNDGRLFGSFSTQSAKNSFISFDHSLGFSRVGESRYGIWNNAFIGGISASGGWHSASSITVMPMLHTSA